MAQPMEIDDPMLYSPVLISSGNSQSQRMEVGSMVQVRVRDFTLYGVIQWIGQDERIGKEPIAGLELEDGLQINYKEMGCTDGTYIGKKYFDSKSERAFFTKLNVCRPDRRFSEPSQKYITKTDSRFSEPSQKYVTKTDSRLMTSVNREWASSSRTDNRLISSNNYLTRHASEATITIEGCILPEFSGENLSRLLGERKGIQGHYNSCYMDSTLFAMFSNTDVFDTALHRKTRSNDIAEYETIQKILRSKIVNPLRKQGFVPHASVLELRKYLDSQGNIGGFMTEEKDPEEFVVLLFEKVLKMDPFIKMKIVGSGHVDVSHLYQIFAEKDERQALPTIKYLVESSFLTSDLQLVQIPSVMILQMPRFGQQKIYKKIQLKSELDISNLMSDMPQSCYICGDDADGYCKACSCGFRFDLVYMYFCKNCFIKFHNHRGREDHAKSFKSFKGTNISKSSPSGTRDRVIMELISVVCIEKSHYVSFVKTDGGEWVFFDSMSDRVGGENGYNIPKVTKVERIEELLKAHPNEILDLDKKKDEQVLRLFQDASLCFYRYKRLSMYR